MLGVLPTSPRRVWCLCTPGMWFRLSQGKLHIISSASTEAQRLWLPRPEPPWVPEPGFTPSGGLPLAWVPSQLAFCGEAAAGGFELILEQDEDSIPGKENPRES